MLDFVFFSFDTMIARFLFFLYPNKSRALKAKRKSLSQEIKNIVDSYIEQVDPIYKEERILFNEENAAELSEENILVKRNSRRKSSSIINEEVDEALKMNNNQKF